MDYKNKYEAALGWMKEVYPTLQGAAKEDAEHYFPELAESEDDRMKKLCISVVKQFAAVCRKEDKYLPEVEKCIAWLEKQGEQKPTELPKGEDYGIDSLWHAQRILEKTLGKVEGYQSDDGILEHKCAIEAVNRLYEQKPADKIEPKFKIGDIIRLKDGDGLEWTVEGVLNNGYYTIVCADRDDFIQLDDKWELVEQKPAWSEEDQKIWEEISDILWKGYKQSCSKFSWDDIRNWLKPKIDFFKDRVQPQPKQEWSEEDKETLKDIITSMTNLKDSATSDALRDIYNSKIAWLKSIRPQSHWKPSEEQMKALQEAIIEMGKSVSPCSIEEFHEIQSLYQDLKKLREE